MRRAFPAVVVLGLAVACGSEDPDDLAPFVDDAGAAGDVPGEAATPIVDAAGADAPREASGDAGDAGADGAPLDADANADGDAGDGGDAGDAGDGGDGGPVGPPPTFTRGAGAALLLRGTVVTPDVAFDGAVLVEGDRIVCAEPGALCDAHPSAATASVIVTRGVIAPGFVDTHNHVLFDVFDTSDWNPGRLFQNHDQWTSDARYQALLDVKQCLANDSQGKPTWCAQTPYGTAAGSLRCEMDKWGELRGLVAGTTSMVGLPGTSSGCFSSLARSVDVIQNGLGQDKIRTSATFPPSAATATSVCAGYAADTVDAFLVHVGEGIDARSRNEFQTLAGLSNGCLIAPETVVTHGTAFEQPELETMATAGMKLVWSPASNVFLYGATTNVPLARSLGVTVALAPDWSLGGGPTMLDELRFAQAWDAQHWNASLTARDLVTLATSNGARALGLDDRLGRVQAGHLADLVVVPASGGDPWQDLVRSRAHDVRLVMVGGVVLYGDKVLEGAAPAAPGCEALDVCRSPKFLCVATTDATNKLDQTSVQIRDTLETAMQTADALTPGDGFDFAPLAPMFVCPP